MEKLKIKIDQTDFGTLCICAIRYCQGRRTYMPDLVREIITPHLSDLSDRDLAVMIDDCESQDRMNWYGDERIDKPGWIEWRYKLEAERVSRRPQGAIPMGGK